MAVIDIFSKRQKKLRGDVPKILEYDKIPLPLRIQIVRIIKGAIGESKGIDSKNNPTKAYKFIHETLCNEYGAFTLSKDFQETYEESILNHVLQTTDVEKALDVVDLAFKYIDRIIKKDISDYTYRNTIKIKPEDAINELNERFKEHGFGYQFESSGLIRIDSKIIHAAITKPTLSLLSHKKFQGANEEYLKAHEHYRSGSNKECLTECLKAFESTLKVICNEKRWAYNQNDTSRKLIQICLQNGLVPSFTQNQFTSLQNLLESGIPTIRNKLSGHGQGQTTQKVDDEITRYGLNLTGTNIVFLIEQSGIV